MATRSCIARPAPGGGFEGIYVHWDGYPSHHLPLLLAARRHRFGGDTEALARHLIDTVPSWSGLGADLLHGAPEPVRTALGADTMGDSDPHSSAVTADGIPAPRMTLNARAASAGWLEWAYILHPHGIETIPLTHASRGPVVDWATDPLTRFSNNPHRWTPTGVPTVTGIRPRTPRRTTTASPPATAQPAASRPAVPGRPAARR